MSDEHLIGVIKALDDDDLRINYAVMKAIFEIDKLTDSVFIDEVDRVYYPLMETICDRFLEYAPGEVYQLHAVKN